MLLRIDLKTLKKNPHAGQDKFIRPIRAPEGTASVNFAGYKSFDLDAQYSFGSMTSLAHSQIGFEHRTTVEFYLYPVNDESIAALKQWAKGINVGANVSYKLFQETETINLMRREPDYLWTRENPKIQCRFCKKTFLYSKLQTVDDDDYYCDRVCPKCERWDCIYVDYESLEEALERQAKEKSK